MQEKRSITGQPDQGGIGRSNFINDEPQTSLPEEERGGYRDLSMIDQCEGNMNNGTVGGNFEEEIQIDRAKAEEGTV